MLRVAYICADSGVPVYGCKGCSVHVQEVIRALGRAGASVTLFAARSEGTPSPGLEHVPLHPLPCVTGDNAKAIEQNAAMAGSLLRGALEHLGPFDIVYERHSLWSYAAMEYARETGIVGLLEVNAPLLEEQTRYRHLSHPALAKQTISRAFAASTTLLAVSESVAEYVNQHSEADGRVHVVPNGVDPARFARLGRSGTPNDRFTVGFVGTLKPWHGLPLLLEAFAELRKRVPCANLLLVGDGPQRNELEERIERLGLTDAVSFTGAVSPQEIPQQLKCMDVTVAPYPPLEGFYFSPLKIFEYMAAGKAIVASAVGQVADILADGETALLCPPGDVRSLTGALGRLYDDPKLRQRLGRKARIIARQRHTWDQVARKILDAASQPTRPAQSLQRVG